MKTLLLIHILSLSVIFSLSFLFLRTLLLYFALRQSSSSLFPHTDVRLWALCPISLTRDRWSSQAGMNWKISRRKHRDFERFPYLCSLPLVKKYPWYYPIDYFCHFCIALKYSHFRISLSRYFHRCYSRHPSSSALNFELSFQLVLPSGFFYLSSL